METVFLNISTSVNKYQVLNPIASFGMAARVWLNAQSTQLERPGTASEAPAC